MVKPWIWLTLLCHTLHWQRTSSHLMTEYQTPIVSLDPPGEAVFSIEFTLDHIVSSVQLANGSIYGIAKVAGDEAYQSLMRQYLDVSYRVSSKQQPPVEMRAWQQALVQGRAVEHDRRSGLIRSPGSSWRDYLGMRFFGWPEYSPGIYDGDEYKDDDEVSILAHAVEASKNATWREMERRFNITSESVKWPYTSIVTPDFIWTTIKPKPDPEAQPDGRVSWNSNFDHDTTWFLHLLRRFNAAVYRNGFRRNDRSDWKDIMRSTGDLIGVSPASAHKALFARVRGGTQCYADHLSPTSIVADYTNATLTLWLDESQPAWTPWNTFSKLGGHVISSYSDDDTILKEHWTQAADKLISLTESISSDPSLGFNLVLSGECWTENTLASFREILQDSQARMKVGVKDILHQMDPFTASMVRAAIGEFGLDIQGECSSRAVHREVVHDEV